MKKAGIGILIGFIVMVSSCHKSPEKTAFRQWKHTGDTNILLALCLWSALFCCQAVRSQDFMPDSLAGWISTRADNRPEEMIYLQISKGIYETGEDLWFKAYVLDAQTLSLSGRSRMLYLQMIAEDGGNAVWQEKYPIEDGIVAGHVYVQDSLRDGNYYLEACTRYSFYVDSMEMSAVRPVKIVQKIGDRDKKTIFAGDSCNARIRFEIFPEGGHLTDGIPSCLAFKVTDGHGYPVDVKGTLYRDGDFLLDFRSVHAGMGVMEFTPESGRTYQIRLANSETFPVSDILPQGMTLRLSGRDSAFLEFEVRQTGEQPAPFYLVGQLRGKVCCVAGGTVKESRKVRLPLDEFPGQGIAVFTLYGENLLPVAERLAYVHPEKKLHITAVTDKKNYLTREKVTVKIRTADEKGNPVPAHLGVSVYDPYYGNPEDPANILTHVYLSSQIRGKIYDPGYYFDEKNPDRAFALDLLLLTQGWRRYVWQADNLTPHGEAVVSDAITGHHTVKKRKRDQAELQLVKVSDVNENAQLIEADSTGYFTVDAGLLKAFNPGYLYLKPLLSDEFKPKLAMDDPFEAIRQAGKMKKTFYPLAGPDNSSELAEERPPVVGRDVILLDEVTVTRKSRRPIRDKHMGRLDSLAQMNLGPWVCECGYGYLENYRPGYTHHPYNNYRGKRLVPIKGKIYTIIKYAPRSDGRFYVVETREVVYNGPEYSDEELLRMNNLWRVKGYYGVREFYHPDETDMQSSLPDARNTLFWSPSVITDGNGEATISFYCSDLNTGFTGRIEGTDGAGLPGMSAFDFRVLKVPVIINSAE